MTEKLPHFSHTDQFDFEGSFGEIQFDFAFARSIFTHTSKSQMEQCFSQLAKVCGTGSVFIASYTPPTKKHNREYAGDQWAGRSHETDEPGMAHYKKETILDIGTAHGFREKKIPASTILQAHQEWVVFEAV